MKWNGQTYPTFKSKVFLGLVCFVLWVYAAPVHAASQREYKIEAAFLYNFLNYITWPDYNTPDEMKKATICFQHGDPIEPYLNYMRMKMQDERQLTIRAVGENSEFEGCQLLFVRGSLPKNRLQEAMRHGVLVVSNFPDFISRGGMIGLAPGTNGVSTEINHSLMKEQGFQVSSRLLSLAKEVR